MRGLTGNIKFDQHGMRTDFHLEIVELQETGLVKVGAWNDIYGVNMSRNVDDTFMENEESIQNKTLVVTTIKVSISIEFSGLKNLNFLE